MVHLALGARRLPLGVHGALLPLLLLPLAYAAAEAAGVQTPEGTRAAVWLALLPLAAIYYLFWRYVVAYLNSLLGVE